MFPNPISQRLLLAVQLTVHLEVFEMFIVALPVRRPGIYVLPMERFQQGIQCVDTLKKELPLINLNMSGLSKTDLLKELFENNPPKGTMDSTSIAGV